MRRNHYTEYPIIAIQYFNKVLLIRIDTLFIKKVKIILGLQNSKINRQRLKRR